MHEGILELSPNSPVGLLGLPFEEGSFPIWQTEFWNRFLLRSGWTDRGFFVYVGAIDDPDVAGYFELRSIGLGQMGLFCVGGPFFQIERRLSRESDAFEKNALFEFSRKLRNLASSCGALFVQYEPLVEVDLPGFRKGEYRHFLEKSTLLLDLRPSEDEILAQMKEKGRYNVRLAQKRGVSVRFSDGNDSDVETFFRLLSETLSRDGFSGNSLEYYRELVRALTSEGIGGLFVAEKDGESVAAAIATFIWGTATYYYGASTSDNEKRRDMPAYALQWEMITEGKRRGCVTYDFLGIAPEGSIDHPLEGVTDFKLKFGGESRQWPDARICVTRPWAYGLLRTARLAKRIMGK